MIPSTPEEMSMRLICKHLAVVVALVMLAGNARAAALFFSSPGPGDVPGLVQVDMWFEDPTRTEAVSAIQFDVQVAPNPPNSLAATPEFVLPNVTLNGGATPADIDVPFDVAAVFRIIMYPNGPRDVRVILASNIASYEFFTVNSLAAQRAAASSCAGPACANQLTGLVNNRVYLGSFNINYDGQAVFLKVPVFSVYACGESPPGFQPCVHDPIYYELPAAVRSAPYCDDPRGCRIAGLAPEPGNLALIAVALVALFRASKQHEAAQGPSARRLASGDLGFLPEPPGFSSPIWTGW